MKEKELREAAVCAVCHQPFGHTGLPFFWRVTIERFGVDIRAVQRQDGLAAMIGSSLIANVMGADEELAKPFMEPVKITVCEECSTENIMIAALVEMGEDGPHKTDETPGEYKAGDYDKS